jgi:hypothetical protein
MSSPFCYEDTDELIEAIKVEPLDNYRLSVLFSNGKTRIYDVKPDLDTPAFSPLKDTDLFFSVKIRHGTVFWDYDHGKDFAKGIDISETALYWDGIAK